MGRRYALDRGVEGTSPFQSMGDNFEAIGSNDWKFVANSSKKVELGGQLA
jgi:hypothetical protein